MRVRNPPRLAAMAAAPARFEIAGLPLPAAGLQFPHIFSPPCVDIRVVTYEIGLQPREGPHAGRRSEVRSS